MAWRFYTKDGAEKKVPTSVVNPTARIKQNSAQTFTVINTWTQMVNLSVEHDTDGMTGTANAITIRHAGRYLLTSNFANNAGTTTGVRIKVNGTVVVYTTDSSNQATGVEIVTTLAAGDVITAEINQSTNGGSTDYANGCWISATKVDGAVVSYVGVPGSLVGQELAYSEITANVSVTGTTEGTATTVITAPSVTVDGSTPIMVDFFAPGVQKGTNKIIVGLWMDGACVGYFTTFGANSLNVSSDSFRGSRRIVPSTGGHAFSVRAFVDTGTGAIQAGPGGTTQMLPAFLRVTRAA